MADLKNGKYSFQTKNEAMAQALVCLGSGKTEADVAKLARTTRNLAVLSMAGDTIECVTHDFAPTTVVHRLAPFASTIKRMVEAAEAALAADKDDSQAASRLKQYAGLVGKENITLGDTLSETTSPCGLITENNGTFYVQAETEKVYRVTRPKNSAEMRIANSYLDRKAKMADMKASTAAVAEAVEAIEGLNADKAFAAVLSSMTSNLGAKVSAASLAEVVE